MNELAYQPIRTIETAPLPEYSIEEIESAMILYGLVYMMDAIRILDKLTKEE